MAPESPYQTDLALALAIADQVDAVTMAGFRPTGVAYTAKEDNTPVTETDRGAEQLIRDIVKRERPEDAVVGEEFGTDGTSRRRWIIDPIDGTANFVRGVEVWASLIALVDGDSVVVGVVSAPALNSRWFAAQGAGAWKGVSQESARRISVSKVATLSDAFISYSSMREWESKGALDTILGLVRECGRERGFGDFLSYMLVAEGVVDIAPEPELALYDMAALVPIVEEAGGRFTALDGTPGPFGGNAVATNGLLHNAVMEKLQ